MSYGIEFETPHGWTRATRPGPNVWEAGAPARFETAAHARAFARNTINSPWRVVEDGLPVNLDFDLSARDNYGHLELIGEA